MVIKLAHKCYLEYSHVTVHGKKEDVIGEMTVRTVKRIEVREDKIKEERNRILKEHPGAKITECIEFDEDEGKEFLEKMAPPGSIDRDDLKSRGIDLDKK